MANLHCKYCIHSLHETETSVSTINILGKTHRGLVNLPPEVWMTGHNGPDASVHHVTIVDLCQHDPLGNNSAVTL